MSAARYDTLVIGGGMSGLPLALRAARHGRTAFVERELLGGTCLNRGCIPTKTMIASASVAHRVSRAADFGVHSDGLRVDLGEVVDRKDDVVESIRAGSCRAVDANGDLDLIVGHGRFTGQHRLQVDGCTMRPIGSLSTRAPATTFRRSTGSTGRRTSPRARSWTSAGCPSTWSWSGVVSSGSSSHRCFDGSAFV